MASVLKLLFFALVVKPLVIVVLGLNVRRRERLRIKGPAIVAANHNSHLDALVLMSLFPLRELPRIRPVAAADYFLRNPLLAWFARNVIGILPIDRTGATAREHLFSGATGVLREGGIVILFPEGTRGEPERVGGYKSGLYHLSRDNPEVPIVPVFLRGLGKVLPRGEALLVPFFCDVFVGERLTAGDDKDEFLGGFKRSMDALAAEGSYSDWD